MFVFQGEKGRSLPGQKGDEVQIQFSSGHALSVTSLQGCGQENYRQNRVLSVVVILCSSITLCVPQGDQGLQGPPGPFEYVDPPEDLYIKGEQVGFSVALLCSSEADQGHWFCQF